VARANVLREDYVELIADLLATAGEARPADVARRLGVSDVSVVKTIARLKRDGLVVSRPYRGVFLTTVGHALAERIRQRHRIVVELLLSVGVPAEARAGRYTVSCETSVRRPTGITRVRSMEETDTHRLRSGHEHPHSAGRNEKLCFDGGHRVGADRCYLLSSFVRE
jgi:DNA-binding MarR family transcriptional regulator